MTETLENILHQEEELQFASFNEDDAWELGSLFVARAKEKGLTVAIDISTKDKVLFHYCFRGTHPDNEYWIARKINLVNRFGHSSWYIGQKLKEEHKTLEQLSVSEKDYAAHGGCFPLTVRKVGIVGTITVSGLPQEEDHAFAVTTIREFIQNR